jgi:hypothetical protein
MVLVARQTMTASDEEFAQIASPFANAHEVTTTRCHSARHQTAVANTAVTAKAAAYKQFS